MERTSYLLLGATLNWKATLATTALLAAITPVAGAEEDVDTSWRCVPATDGAATSLTVGSVTYYQKLYPSGGYSIEELWQENNGERGLQTSASLSCVAKGDKMLRSQCVGFCPLTL
jgi:hypothetical protein